MTAPVFVDTNVIVYRFDTTDPRKQSRAVDWFTFLWNRRSGCVSFQMLQEAYAVLTRKRKPAMASVDAQRIVRGLAAWQPVTMDHRILERAWLLIRSTPSRPGRSCTPGVTWNWSITGAGPPSDRRIACRHLRRAGPRVALRR